MSYGGNVTEASISRQSSQYVRTSISLSHRHLNSWFIPIFPPAVLQRSLFFWQTAVLAWYCWSSEKYHTSKRRFEAFNTFQSSNQQSLIMQRSTFIRDITRKSWCCGGSQAFWLCLQWGKFNPEMHGVYTSIFEVFLWLWSKWEHLDSLLFVRALK